MPVESNERRDFPRTPIELKVEYKRLNTFFHDYTRNISKGGTFIRTKKLLDVGTEFLFKLVVPELEEPLVLKGKVKWIIREEEAGNNPKYSEPGMGIQFIYETDEDRYKIENIVERLMKKHLGERTFAKLMGKI